MRRILAVVLVSTFALLLTGGSVSASPGLTRAKMGQISRAIRDVRRGATFESRVDAAERLANVTEGIDSMFIPPAVVDDIRELLDSPSDPVRYWAAMALGHLGSAAEAAIPELLKILPAAECVDGVITSASGIRYALMKLKAWPPRSMPPTCSRNIRLVKQFTRDEREMS